MISLRPHDVRRQQHDDVGLRSCSSLLPRTAASGRHVNRARETRAATCVSSSRSRPASRFDSPSRRRRRVVTLRVPNDGHVDAGDVDVGACASCCRRQVEDDVAFERHARRHVDVDADVLVAERAQRVHAGAAGRDRRVAGRDDRNLRRRGSASASCLPRRAAAASRRAWCWCRSRGTARWPSARPGRSRPC